MQYQDIPSSQHICYNWTLVHIMYNQILDYEKDAQDLFSFSKAFITDIFHSNYNWLTLYTQMQNLWKVPFSMTEAFTSYIPLCWFILGHIQVQDLCKEPFSMTVVCHTNNTQNPVKQYQLLHSTVSSDISRDFHCFDK